MICAVLSCDRTDKARGWCSRHYERWRTTGDERAEVPNGQGNPGGESPTCPTCGISFYVCCYQANDGTPVSYRCVSCKETFRLSEEAVA